MSGLHLDTVRGAGRPLVLLHGVYLDHHLWGDVRQLLPGRSVVALDMPGHGRSRPMTADESIDDVADSVADAVRAVGVHDAIWVGHSWGGWTLARLVRRHPDLVAGAVYSNTPARRASGSHRTGFVTQRWLLRLGFPTATYGRLAAKSLYDRSTLEGRPDLVGEMADRSAAMGRAQLIRTLSNVVLGTDDSIDLMAATPVPYRVVAGEHDYVLTDEVAERFAPVLHRAEGGHITPQEDPAAIVAALDALERGLDGAALTAIATEERPR